MKSFGTFLSILVYNPSETDVTNFVNNMFTSLPDYNDGLKTVDEIVKLIMEDEYGYTLRPLYFWIQEVCLCQ